MDFSLIGVLGLGLLVLAWIPETLTNLKRKGEGLDAKFALLYLFGSMMLAAYSHAIGDMVFFTLNALAGIIAAINLYLIVRYRMRAKNAKTKRRR